MPFAILLFAVAVATNVVIGGDLWSNEVTHDLNTMSAISFLSEFKAWKLKFNVNYANTVEQAYRLKIWRANWKMINDWNLQQNISYTLKMNRFGDLTSKEFGDRMLSKNAANTHKSHNNDLKNNNVPSSIDWTNYNGDNYVTPVQNQGTMGSSVAIFGTASISSLGAIATQTDPLLLSSQELVECVANFSALTTVENVYQFVIENRGLCKASEYNSVNAQCGKDKCTAYDWIDSYVEVGKYDASALENAVGGFCPVVVGVDASETFQFYSSGIITHDCGSNINHIVMTVGYGEDADGVKYWKCQNSWGVSWGMNGYVLIGKELNHTDKAGVCGILTQPIYPDLL